MATTGKGSIIKFTLNVDEASMGDKTLAQCDFKVDFYATTINSQGKPTTPTSIFTASKTGDVLVNCVKDTEDDNTYYCMCDTTDLNTGKLAATFTVEYTDVQLDQKLKEVMTLTTDITITNVPVSPDPESSNDD